MTTDTGLFQGKECDCPLQHLVATGTYTTGDEYGMVPETVRQMLCTKCGFKWIYSYQTTCQVRSTTLILNHDDAANGSGLDETVR